MTTAELIDGLLDEFGSLTVNQMTDILNGRGYKFTTDAVRSGLRIHVNNESVDFTFDGHNKSWFKKSHNVDAVDITRVFRGRGLMRGFNQITQ